VFLRNDENVNVNKHHDNAGRDVKADYLNGSEYHLRLFSFLQRFRENPREGYRRKDDWNHPSSDYPPQSARVGHVLEIGHRLHHREVTVSSHCAHVANGNEKQKDQRKDS